jgi:hypothetical protein
MEVWTTEEEKKVRVVLPGGSMEYKEEVTVEDVKEWARRAGIKKFTVEDGDGFTLSKNNFPITEGEIYIKEYNEAGQ